MDVVGALVGVDGLQVQHVADGVVLQGDAASPEDVPGHAGGLEGLPDVLPFGQGDLGGGELPFVLEAGEPPGEEEAFKAPIRDQYDTQGSPYYSTARLWDDGVIDPAETRRVLGMGLAVTSQVPTPDPHYGIFRM